MNKLFNHIGKSFLIIGEAFLSIFKGSSSTKNKEKSYIKSYRWISTINPNTKEMKTKQVEVSPNTSLKEKFEYKWSKKKS